jgi:dipeptidyl aminopeptidase/acylaminoacyl peptidase
MPLARIAGVISRLAGLLVFSALYAVGREPAAQHFPTNEDLRHTQQIGAPELSPDASQVLITVTEPTADGGKSHVWLVEIAGNTCRQLTFSPKGDEQGESDPRWLQDGSAILFLAKRGETKQIFRLPMHGGEAAPYDLKIVPATEPDAKSTAQTADEKTRPDADKKTADKEDSVPLDVDNFEISADGRWLAVLAKDPQSKAEKKKDTDKDDADFVDHDPHLVRLYLLPLDKSGAAAGSLLRVEVPPDVRGVAWAPRSNLLAAVTEEPHNVGDLHPARAASIVTRSGNTWKTTALPKIPPTIDEKIVWSKDEKDLLILAQTQQDAPPGVSDLYAADVKTGESRMLSHDFPGSLHQIVASEDNAAIAVVTIGTTTTIARFPLSGENAVPLSFAQPSVVDLNTNLDQSGWTYLQSGTAIPPMLCFARTLNAGCTRLSAPDVIPQTWRSVPAQVIQWKNGSYTIDGLLYLPPQAEHGKVPLIVDVHGGPTGQFTQAYSAFAQFLVGQGWAVLQPNPRGSTGYGAAFAAANKNDLGGGDYQDIMTGVDAVIARFAVNPEKMALIGYSYGGEMAGFVEGKTTRFRAIVSGAPVIDQMSEYGTEDSSFYDRWFYGYPWEHSQDALRQSPISAVAHAKTPFLLLQGKADTTDPAGQSEEMYRALRQAGVSVELVEYPRENHGPLAMGMVGYPSHEPWHGFDARKHLVDFIDKQFQPAAK